MSEQETSQAPGPASRVGLLVLFLLAATLRLFPIDHGAPDNHVPDTHVVRAALGMANDRDPVPPVGRWSTYPNLLPYTLVPCFAAQYAVGRATGEWSGAGEYAAVLKEHPERAHLLARRVLALLSALLPVVLVLGLRAAGLGAGAWFGGALGATSLLLVHLGLHERPWAPLATFTALTMAAGGVHARSGSGRALLLSGVGAALAFSTHQAGALTVLIPALAWAASPRGWSGGELRERLTLGLRSALCFLVLALAVGHPYLVRYGATPTEAVAAGEHLAHNSAVSIGGQSVVFQLSGATFARLSKALASYDPVLLLFALLGLLPALRSRACIPAAGFTLLWGAFFLTNQNDHVRYLIPMAAGLCWPAAVAFERLRPGLRPWAALALLVPMVQAVRLGVVLRRDDTRALARADLERLDLDGAVGIDAGGPPVALTLDALGRLEAIRPLRAREEHRQLLLDAGLVTDAGLGLDAVPLEDVFEFDVRHRASWTRPAALAALGVEEGDADRTLDALRCSHVLLADRTPLDGHPPALLDPRAPSQEPGPDLASHEGGVRPKLPPISVEAEPLQVWSPGDGVTDARLPLELDNPLIELWRIERPGPRLSLHRRLPAEHRRLPAEQGRLPADHERPPDEDR